MRFASVGLALFLAKLRLSYVGVASVRFGLVRCSIA